MPLGYVRMAVCWCISLHFHYCEFLHIIFCTCQIITTYSYWGVLWRASYWYWGLLWGVGPYTSIGEREFIYDDAIVPMCVCRVSTTNWTSWDSSWGNRSPNARRRWINWDWRFRNLTMALGEDRLTGNRCWGVSGNVLVHGMYTLTFWGVCWYAAEWYILSCWLDYQCWGANSSPYVQSQGWGIWYPTRAHRDWVCLYEATHTHPPDDHRQHLSDPTWQRRQASVAN